MDPSELASIPLDALGSEFAARLPTLEEVEQVRWIEAADRLSSGAGLDRRRASLVLRALTSRIDPATEEGARRARCVLAEGQRDAAVAELAGRCAERGGGDLAAYAQVVLGQVAADARDRAAAEGAFLRVLSRTRGSGMEAERAALSSLARLYQAQGREFEALLLARRFEALAVVHGAPHEQALAACRMADAYRSLDAREELGDALARLEKALALLAADDGLLLRRRLAMAKVDVALRDGDGAGAALHLGQAESLFALPASDPSDPRWLPLMRARLALSLGRLEEARGHLDRCLEVAPLGDYNLIVGQAVVGWALAAGRREEAFGEGVRMLEALEADGPEGVGAGHALEQGVWLSEQFEGTWRALDEARRAYDVAGSGVVERIRQIDRATAVLPELDAAAPLEHRLLAVHRARFLAKQGALLARVAQVLAPRLLSSDATLPSLSQSAGFLRVCAWCRRAALRDGTWLPIGQFLAPGPGLRITHGICATCAGAPPQLGGWEDGADARPPTSPAV